MSLEDNQNSDPKINEGLRLWEESQKKFQEWGHLGVTAQDHWNIGGSPPWKLNQNPGKTLGELMTGEELLDNLDKLKVYLEDAKIRSQKDPHNDLARSDLEYALKALPLNIKYLKSIGRLPVQYENFEIG